MGKKTLVVFCMLLIGTLVAFVMLRNTAAASFVPDSRRGVLDSIVHRDATRDFIVHIPKSTPKDKPRPVILAFHGMGGSGAQFLRQTNLDKTADKHEFIAVFPNGLEHPSLGIMMWNARLEEANQNAIADDVGFVRALIDHLVARYNADAERIYATGTSNGAIFCYRILCDLSDKVAAIATNAGVDVYNGQCPNFTPRSILHVHDKNDRLVPIAGKDTRMFSLPSVAVTLNEWSSRLGCVDLNPNMILEDSLHQIFRYAPCANGSEILYYLTKDGGHIWPGSTPSRILAARPSKAFKMNDLIWSFFKKNTIE